MKNAQHHSFWYRNGLSIFAISLFVVFLFAQALTGWNENNKELAENGGAVLGFVPYLTSGHFVQATFENFESEFLQMFLYVLCTIRLRQWGSSESKKLDGKEEVDREPIASKDAPWPVKKGGVVLTLYKNSLCIVFFLLFAVSWVLHACGSYADYSVEENLKGRQVEEFISYLGDTKLWFESFQNWQSEFLSIASIVVLSIFLRQQGSPESKPVDTPHHEIP